MLELDAICSGPHGVAVPPGSPLPIVQIGIVVATLGVVVVGVDQSDELVDPVTEVGVRSCGRAEHRVHEGSHAPQIHLVEGRIAEDKGLKSVGGSGSKVIVGEGVVEISGSTGPVTSEAEVDIPDEGPPFTGPIGVPVKVVVLVSVVPVVDQVKGCEVIDRSRNVDVVIAIAQLGFSGQSQPADQGLKVAITLILPGLLIYPAGRGVQAIVHLVECPPSVETGSLEVAVVPVFHEVCYTEESGVLLDADGEGEVSGFAGAADQLVSEGVAGLGLVGPVSEHIDVLDALFSFPEAESVALVEVKIVAFLGESPGRLAMAIGLDVVIELPKEVNRAA